MGIKLLSEDFDESDADLGDDQPDLEQDPSNWARTTAEDLREVSRKVREMLLEDIRKVRGPKDHDRVIAILDEAD